jgi:hypothetical protein
MFRRASRRDARSRDDSVLRALAALSDDHLHDLSEAGRQLRRKALQQTRCPRAHTPRMRAWPSQAA